VQLERDPRVRNSRRLPSLVAWLPFVIKEAVSGLPAGSSLITRLAFVT
jgi:hypothetical protein